VTAIGSRGYIKITSYMKHIDEVPTLVLDLEASKFQLDKQKAVNIRNLTIEKDFKRIMGAEVELNLKIAKALVNSLGWKIECPYTASRYSLYIPLIHPLYAPPEVLDNEDAEIAEERKEDRSRTPLTGAGGRCFSK